MEFLMDILKELGFLVENLSHFFGAGGWKYPVMWLIGGVLIYLAIRHDMEPTLLLPMGFGTILVNIPLSGAIGEHGALTTLFNAGIVAAVLPFMALYPFLQKYFVTGVNIGAVKE